MDYRHLTTSAQDYSGIQMRLTLEVGHDIGKWLLLRTLDKFAELARGAILQRVAGGEWIIRNIPYGRLELDRRGPHGSKFSLRIPSGARPLRPEDFVLMVAEMARLIREKT